MVAGSRFEIALALFLSAFIGVHRRAKNSALSNSKHADKRR
jgi:hypothetical protein